MKRLTEGPVQQYFASVQQQLQQSRRGAARRSLSAHLDDVGRDIVVPEDVQRCRNLL